MVNDDTYLNSNSPIQVPTLSTGNGHSRAKSSRSNSIMFGSISLLDEFVVNTLMDCSSMSTCKFLESHTNWNHSCPFVLANFCPQSYCEWHSNARIVRLRYASFPNTSCSRCQSRPRLFFWQLAFGCRALQRTFVHFTLHLATQTTVSTYNLASWIWARPTVGWTNKWVACNPVALVLTTFLLYFLILSIPLDELKSI